MSSLLPSVDELTFDIKRLTTKLEILEGEKQILEKELLISKQSNSAPSKEYSLEFDKMRNDLHVSRTLVVKLREKYEVIKNSSSKGNELIITNTTLLSLDLTLVVQ